MVDKSSIGRMVYLGMNVMFLVGWLCALIGLALAQQDCKDSPTQAQALRSSFTAFEMGKNCRKFYRLPWFVWALNTVPVLLAVVAVIKPHLARGATTAFFSVLAPLDILLAHDFFNRSEVADSMPGFSSKDVRKFEVTLAGFAIMAAMALLLLLLDSLLAVAVKPNASTAEAAHHQGGVGTTTVNKV